MSQISPSVPLRKSPNPSVVSYCTLPRWVGVYPGWNFEFSVVFQEEGEVWP